MTAVETVSPLIWEITNEGETGIKKASVDADGNLRIIGKKFNWYSENHFTDTAPIATSDTTRNRQRFNAGHTGEQETWNLFLDLGVPPELVFKPGFVSIAGIGEYEVSDGLIIYGDTAFLLQVKTRTASNEGRDIEWMRDKIRDSRYRAYNQAIKSLEIIEEHGGVWFENFKGEKRFIKKEDYNWTALIVLAYNELIPAPPTRYVVQEGEQEELNRITITLKELKDIARIYNDPKLLLNYLRRIQYQGVDCVGYEALRLFQMIDAGIYPEKQDEECIVRVLDSSLLDYRFTDGKPIQPGKLREIFNALDYLPLETISNLQREFTSAIEATGMRKMSFYHDALACSIFIVDDEVLGTGGLPTTLAIEGLTAHRNNYVKYSLSLIFSRKTRETIGVSLIQVLV